MAKISFPGLAEYELMLARLAKSADDVAGRAIHQGAAIIADEIRKNIQSLPSQSGITKEGLLDGLGIAPLQEENGYYNVKIGFDGYNQKGVANQLMARVFEGGTSKVKKRPFVRTAVNAKKKEAQTAMAAVLDQEIQKIMK